MVPVYYQLLPLVPAPSPFDREGGGESLLTSAFGKSRSLALLCPRLADDSSVTRLPWWEKWGGGMLAETPIISITGVHTTQQVHPPPPIQFKGLQQEGAGGKGYSAARVSPHD